MIISEIVASSPLPIGPYFGFFNCSNPSRKIVNKTKEPTKLIRCNFI